MLTDRKKSPDLAGSFQKIIGILLALILAGSGVHALAESDFIAVGRFSSAAPGDALPHSWDPLEFKKIQRHTRYTLVQDDGRVVLKAVSEQSASGLAKRVRIDPREFQKIDWQWKPTNISGVVIMTDSDNTGQSATAFFGDITFRKN